jgi:hypothetical protein
MFEYKYPLFNPAPLRREILDAMRDLAAREQAARYGEYSDGILAGCNLFERNMRVGVDSGLVKFGGRVYVLSEPVSVPYRPTDEWTVLKIRFGGEERTRDFLRYSGELILDANTNVLPNEMELGRFKLKQGSRLRTVYEDFQDMETEYDTVNLINVPYAGVGEATLCPAILLHFGREAYSYAADPPDAAFAAACLSQNGVMSREMIKRYLAGKLGLDSLETDNAKLHLHLVEVMFDMKGIERNKNRDEPSGIILA